jgi:heptosyltransferase-2
MHNRKILIIRLSSLGDVLLSTPFIRQVRLSFPQAKIDYLAKEAFKDLLEENPHLNDLILFSLEDKSKNLFTIREHLKQQKYDYIFDLHNNLRSNYLCRGLKANYIGRIKKDKFKQVALVHLKKNYYKKPISIPERYLAVGTPVNVRDDQYGLELYWSEKARRNLEKTLSVHKITIDGKYLCIAPGASFFTKRWPLEYYEKLLDYLTEAYSYKVVILGGSEEIEIGKYLNRNNRVIDLCGKLTLIQNAMVMSKSKALISNDSGLMHMATAVKIPVLAIFGPSVKELGFFPYRSSHIVIEKDSISCRPCSHIGRQNCPKKHFKCMLEISPLYVLARFRELLETREV